MGSRRVRVCYSGRVQGVGFRFNAVQQSKGLAVSGFVRNEMDGTVLLEAEGERSVLKTFLEAIRTSRLQDNIRDENIEWGEATGAYAGAGFDVRH